MVYASPSFDFFEMGIFPKNLKVKKKWMHLGSPSLPIIFKF